MTLYKVNDVTYVNVDYITQIYWHKAKETWAFDIIGQDVSTFLTNKEKDDLVDFMQMQSGAILF